MVMMMTMILVMDDDDISGKARMLVFLFGGVT